MILKDEELNIVRQWFDSIQETYPDSLMICDYEIAMRIYQALGMKVPDSIAANAKDYV